MEDNHSPLPQNGTKASYSSFFDILPEVLHGKKIARLEWESGIYGFIGDGELRIQVKTEVHSWIVSTEDMEATDWMIYNEEVLTGEVVS